MNILYATTKGWNIGDEAILEGCTSLMTSVHGIHNKFIYNKHPYLAIKPVEGEVLNLDNSVDLGDNLDFIDAFVMAGTPSNFDGLNEAFNIKVKNRKPGVPAYYLGLGQSIEGMDENLYSFMKDVDLVTVRDESLVSQYREKGINAQYMPCPALYCFKGLSSPQEIILVPRISIKDKNSLHSITEEQFEYQTRIFNGIIKKYSGEYPIRVISHYSHEVPILSKLYRNINFSYNLEDYISFYLMGCLVVSSRVHGCGIASSLGIPNIGFNQDFRQNTLDGFLTRKMDYNFVQYMYIIDDILKNRESISTKILDHRNKTFLKYRNMLKESSKKGHKK